MEGRILKDESEKIWKGARLGLLDALLQHLTYDIEWKEEF
jgi:hypothetical protein